MEDKCKLISSVLDEIESNREIETDVVVKNIADKIKELGFSVAEDMNDAEEDLKEMGFSPDEFEYNLYDDDCVREPIKIKEKWKKNLLSLRLTTKT